ASQGAGGEAVASISDWLDFKRASSAARAAELLQAVEHQRGQRDSAERGKAAELLEALVAFAQADQKEWAALTPEEFEIETGGEFYRGRTARARDAIEAERLAVEALRKINGSEDYKKAEVLLRQGAWEEAHRLLAHARAEAENLLLLDEADAVPDLWFAWRAQ